MKKLLSVVGLGFASVVAKAQDAATGDGIVSPTDVESIFEQAQTNMASLIDAALPVVIAFVVGGLTIWGAIALIGVLKRAFGAGKGR